MQNRADAAIAAPSPGGRGQAAWLVSQGKSAEAMALLRAAHAPNKLDWAAG